MLYTVKEVASILKTNVNFVYELIRRGLLPAMKLGSYKIRKDALDRFLEKYEGYDLTDLKNIIGLKFDVFILLRRKILRGRF